MKRLLITLVALLACNGVAAECAFDLEVGDNLQLSQTSIEVAADCIKL